jgi:hypothetical protein
MRNAWIHRGPLSLLFLLIPASHAQQPPPLPRTFSIPPAVEIQLTTDWVELREQKAPPPSQLLPAAPRVNFTDVLALENRQAHALVEVLVSDNPFEGFNPQSLDQRMHAGQGAGLMEHFFYFFFPPPRNCLVLARAAVDAARSKDNEHPSVQRGCDFSPTLADFYASQISSGVSFHDKDGRPIPRGFYVPGTESVELDGKTFFLFEALADRAIDRPEVDQFNLPDDLRGRRAHFFWAAGTNAPFPFVRDPSRKNVRLIHLVYASLSRGGEGRDEFREMLGKLRFN